MAKPYLNLTAVKLKMADIASKPKRIRNLHLILVTLFYDYS